MLLCISQSTGERYLAPLVSAEEADIAVLEEKLLCEQRPWAPAPGRPPVSQWLLSPGASHLDSTVGPAGHLHVSMGPPTPPSPARVLSVCQVPAPLGLPKTQTGTWGLLPMLMNYAHQPLS